MNKEIIVYKKDVVPYVYFVCSMAQQSKNGMFGALSTKKDMIGGIFDRWINIIPESISFNKYFLPLAKEMAQCSKEVRVYSDFYMYDPKVVGIAPDVIGIQIDSKIIPFVKYDDTRKDSYWEPQESCPQIEVKSFFGTKYMVSLRNQHYDNKYLVMVGANITSDYLLPFFNTELFNKQELEKINMPEQFIKHDTKKMINNTKEVDFNNDKLGTINILTVTNASDFMNMALQLNQGDIPRYFKNIEERKTYIKPEKFSINNYLSEYCDKQESGLYRFNSKWYELFTTPKEKTLDIDVSKPEKLKIIKKNNDNIVVLAEEDLSFNGFSLEQNKQYNINFGTFGAVAGKEYFVNKNETILKHLPNKEEELITLLAEIIKKN